MSVRLIFSCFVANQNGDVDGALKWLDKGEEAYPDAVDAHVFARRNIAAGEQTRRMRCGSSEFTQ